MICQFSIQSFSLPWNQTTFLGYSVEIAFTIYQGQTYMISNGVLLLFFISKCYHHQAFYSMFKHSVAKLEQSDANQSDKRLLCDLIQFHVSIREWVEFNSIICFQFQWRLGWRIEKFKFVRFNLLKCFIQSNLNILGSWFLESTDAFSPLVGAQLLSSMIILATAVFQIDLVTINLNFIPKKSNTFSFAVLLFCSNSNTWIRVCWCFWSQLCLVYPHCTFTVTLENWPLKALWWCPTVYLNQIGKTFGLICRNALF